MSTLVAQERKNFKKSTSKKLRNDGKIPAIVYGNNIDTKSISIKNADLLKVMRDIGRNGILSLSLDGKSKNVMLRDYQNDPVTREILHVDFLQVDKHTEINAKVSVILKGTSKGEKVGGIAKQYLHELDITAKANDIPNDIEIDITDSEIGHAVKVADIKKDYSNCSINHEDDETIVMIDYVKSETEEAEDASKVEVSGV
ncbi:50S ribosomal protein L25/general stress protein Ctc [Neobacillus bataviensis LMG 21833]|uniref:Large ribosomal subunit protein bL25 n=1 Tax=Neobacillus bataviensis LMG 21833 TaxID=1117379 RepID=K6EDE1_9BACI|nr:50S ribosomal protein L25 [Neobacillus bataviensis]EKN71471.1 50S ribosomal protein L25/general stress protein Ctc [Neobacillus bataviensis LMG 21833]